MVNGLNQIQSQQQKLSPQMIQSINILADNTDSLLEKIYEEADRNPALEVAGIRTIKVKSVNPDSTRVSERYSPDQKRDQYQTFLESSPETETLQEHLLRQLDGVKINDEEREIGERIIQNLDEKGYHIVALESLFPGEKFVIAKKVLKIIHEFEPVGVACKNLQESLFIQAYEDYADDFTLEFIKNDFDLLENPKPAVIQKKLLERGQSATIDEIQELIAFIRGLDPFPAREYESVQTVFISPDIEVTKEIDEDGKEGFKVDLVKTNLPEIRINPKILEFQDSNEKMKKCVSEAEAFINAIEMRNQTLLNVATQLLTEQMDFFKKGSAYLKPLRLIDIAEKLGVHETTVSRIANSKYLHCEWGLFELKYFFSNAVKVSNDGDNSSSGEEKVLSKEAIKQQLAKIISENEKNGGKSLSDQKLCDKLAEQGINIARRTVAKYRAELNLNSSYER